MHARRYIFSVKDREFETHYVKHISSKQEADRFSENFTLYTCTGKPIAYVTLHCTSSLQHDARQIRYEYMMPKQVNTNTDLTGHVFSTTLSQTCPYQSNMRKQDECVPIQGTNLKVHPHRQ